MAPWKRNHPDAARRYGGYNYRPAPGAMFGEGACNPPSSTALRGWVSNFEHRRPG